MNTLKRTASRVIHSRGAIVECPNGHTWKAQVELVSIGQYALSGHGVTPRYTHEVEPAQCPHCAAQWRMIHDSLNIDIVRIEFNTRDILSKHAERSHRVGASYRLLAARQDPQ